MRDEFGELSAGYVTNVCWLRSGIGWSVDEALTGAFIVCAPVCGRLDSALAGRADVGG